MSFKNDNDIDNSFEWGDYENWEEYDNENIVVNNQVSDVDDYDSDLEDNRIYISGKFKSFSAPKPITLKLSKKINNVIEKKDEEDKKDFDEYKEVMKTKLTWLAKPTIVEYDSDDSDYGEVVSKPITISEDDYPTLSSEIFKKNKKEEVVIKKEEPSLENDVVGWKSIDKKKRKNEKDEPVPSVEFTRPCSTWIEGTKCNRKGCTYAHSKKELKINECTFKNCNIVIEKDGYFSNKNGDRICNKIHRTESVDNFIERLGVKSKNDIPDELKYALSLLSNEKYIEFEGVKYFGKLCNKEEPKKKEKTQMCRSVNDKTKCPHKSNCRYAHNFNELVVSLCDFNEKCRVVKMDKKGIYTNSVDGKVCCYRHPGETKDNYRKRVRV